MEGLAKRPWEKKNTDRIFTRAEVDDWAQGVTLLFFCLGTQRAVVIVALPLNKPHAAVIDLTIQYQLTF